MLRTKGQRMQQQRVSLALLRTIVGRRGLHYLSCSFFTGGKKKCSERITPDYLENTKNHTSKSNIFSFINCPRRAVWASVFNHSSKGKAFSCTNSGE